MSVQIIIRSEKDPSYYIEQEFFNPEEINIGSDESNQIILEDPNNRVSRQHVQIMIDGKNYYLIDKGSEFGTYIQGKKIASNTPMPFDNTIEFTVGGFDVALTITGQDTQYADENILVGNPFDEDVQALSSVLNRLSHRYQLEEKNKKKTFLTQALREMIDENNENEILQILFETLEEQNHYQVHHSLHSSEVLLDTLLKTIKSLMQINEQFRNEFLGESVGSDGRSLDYNSINTMKEYLLQSGITQEESQNRLSELHKELNIIIMHQVALVNGYYYGVQEGSHALLREMNPTPIQEKVEKTHGLTGLMKRLYEWMPSLLKLKMFQQLQSKYSQFMEKGKQYIEKKFFREPFIRKYQESYRHNNPTEEMVKFSMKSDTTDN